MSFYPDRVGVNIFDVLTVRKYATSQSGRLLDEFEAYPEAVRVAQNRGQLSLVKSPFPDSRGDSMVNMHPMREIHRDWPDLKAGFGWIKKNYRGIEGDEGLPSVEDLINIVRVGFALPTYLFKRANSPISETGELPEVVAGLYKTSKGLLGAFLSFQEAPPAEFPRDRTEYFNEVVKRGLLVKRSSNRGCPATSDQIMEMADQLMFQEPKELTGIKDFVWEDLVDDFPRLLGFSQIFHVSTVYARQYREAISEMGLDLGYGNQPLERGITLDLLHEFSQAQRAVNLFLGRDDMIARPLDRLDIKGYFRLGSKM